MAKQEMRVTGGLDWTLEEQAWVREHAGMYMWEEPREGPADPDYTLLELNALGRRLGLRVVRTFLGGYGLGRGVAESQTFIDTLKTESYRDFIASFPTIFFTVAIPPETWDPAWTVPHYQELTEYLLSAWPDKTFILGNWEGDYWCPGKRTWDEAVGLFTARQEGIERGRAAVTGATSKVYHMIEMVKLDYTGKDLMINNLAPRVPADLYSLSCYGYINELPRALEYMRSKCLPSPDFGHDNLVLGEWGVSYSIKWPPEQRARFFQQRVREMIAARLAYCLYWELEDKDDGLLDGKYQRGRKFTLYYPFYRAYHAADDALTVDDFEADPLGMPGGDQDEWGHSINTLGGRRGPSGEATGALLWQPAVDGRQASRVLAVTFPEGCATGSGWREELLGELDASERKAINLSVCGDLSGISITLSDAAGSIATQALVVTQNGAWQDVVLSRESFAGVDWSRLSAIIISLDQPGDGRVVLIDTLQLPKQSNLPAAVSQPSPAIPRLSHFALRGSDCEIMGHTDSGPVQRLDILTPLDIEPLVAPSVTDGSRTVRFASKLPALHSVTLRADGEGEVRFEPLSCFMYPDYFARLGVTAFNLERHDDVTRGIWGDIFPAFQLLSENEPGYLEWSFTSPWPVSDFQLKLYLHSREDRPPAGGVGVAVSMDGKAWAECATFPPASTIWHEDTLVASPSDGMQLGQNIRVRYWIKAIADDPDWRLHAGIRNIKARLTLDTRAADFPEMNILRYQDCGPCGDTFRGLLNVDW